MSFENPSTTLLEASIEPCWRLLAIGLDPDRTVPDLYGAIHEGEADVPLMADGRIVFFADPARAAELIRQHGAPWGADPMDVGKSSLWYDVA
jgi:hypothetical protein